MYCLAFHSGENSLFPIQETIFENFKFLSRFIVFTMESRFMPLDDRTGLARQLTGVTEEKNVRKTYEYIV